MKERLKRLLNTPFPEITFRETDVLWRDSPLRAIAFIVSDEMVHRLERPKW